MLVVLSAQVIQVDGARRVIELAREAREIGLGTEAAREHIAAAVLDLVGAACCIVVLDPAHYPDGTKGLGARTAVNFTSGIANIYDTLVERGCSLHPVHRALMREHPHPAAEQVVGATDEIISRREWTGSELFNEYFRAAHVDRYLTSVHYAGENNVQGFGIFRATGDGPFSDEDRNLVHLLHLALGPVFSPAPERVTLAPRVRQTLDVLLTGASDKEIAAELHISRHTVRQYVKTILEAYKVSSRAHLIARMARFEETRSRA